MKGVGEAFNKVLTILSSPILQLALLGIVGLVVWRKIFGSQQSVADVVNNTIDAAATLPGGVASAALSVLRGENESTYISQDEARQLAQDQLHKKLAGG